MNLLIKHNGTNITSRVISYQREHRICTGIGTLDISLEGTYATAIDPWDEFDIYENGQFKVKYYVSDVVRDQPGGVITAQCQDISKRLVDYFIPTSYTIDYPSYTRYWINKFLTEAGISVSFQTSSQGNLISNNTVLGLQPAYDQIMTLLQLSGWFMYFSGDEKAVIGPLSVDLASSVGSVGKSDILDIKRLTHDKMLRNRALVWGQYNPTTGRYAFADVRKHTPWNYDRNDVRTIVISNHNIPDSEDAYNLANKLIKEFARATIEKHITVHGARNYTLGRVLKVSSKTWSGRGLITTFGVNMDRNGLVTTVSLDERCPRLFGFFDFGDYVYVGTFGDGIWRKHIKYDPTWYNFSTGLTDLNITDLHIKDGVFGSVGHSGAMFYTTNEDGPWLEITRPESLMSSVEDTVTSGITASGVAMQPYSGIMARAVIIDKSTNNIKFAVDNWSGINTGDYFMMYSGLSAVGSGVTTSGDYRGWLLEYDSSTGLLVGDLYSGIYPISYSGNYSVQVLDLENDGINDYVSVRVGATQVIENDGSSWNFGAHLSQPFASTKEPGTFSVTPENIQHVEDNTQGWEGWTQKCGSRYACAFYDNELSNEMCLITVRRGSGSTRSVIRRKLTRTFTGDNQTNITSTSSEKTCGFEASNTIAIKKIGTDAYRFWYYTATSSYIEVFYTDWDAYADTISSQTSLYKYDFIRTYNLRLRSITLNNKAYIVVFGYHHPSASEISASQTYLDFPVVTVDMVSNTANGTTIFSFALPKDDTANNYYNIPGNFWRVEGDDIGYATRMFSSGGNMLFGLFQNGTELPRIVVWFSAHHHRLHDGWTFPYTCSSREYFITGDVTTLNIAEIYNNTVTGAVAERYIYVAGHGNNLQLTASKGMVWGNKSSPVDGSANGTLALTTLPSLITGATTDPPEYNYYRVYPLLNDGNYYVYREGSGTGTHYLMDAGSLTVVSQITAPAGYTLLKPYSSPLHSLFGEVYYLCNDSGFNSVLIPFLEGNLSVSRVLTPQALYGNQSRGINVGGFFIDEPLSWETTDPAVSVSYIDMLKPYDNDAVYRVLQRSGSEFKKIREAGKPIRIDISNTAPVLTVLDKESTFNSAYINGNELTVVIPISGLQQRDVRDYRYTLLETVSGTQITMSGAGVTSQILYVSESNIYHSDINYSGGFMVLDTIGSGLFMVSGITVSGMLERIETTNYTYPGQFLFVTTSGDNPMFYQKDNDASIFMAYSGLPDSRATIIRIDDAV